MNMEKNYAIVRFLEEDGAPGIVVTDWISEDGAKCKYPNVRTNEARDKLIKGLAKPTEEWITCSIKILHEYETFSDARLYLKKAEDTSNLESEPEENITRRRKRRRKILVLPGEDDTSEEAEELNYYSFPKRNLKEIPYPTPINAQKPSSVPKNNSLLPSFCQNENVDNHHQESSNIDNQNALASPSSTQLQVSNFHTFSNTTMSSSNVASFPQKNNQSSYGYSSSSLNTCASNASSFSTAMKSLPSSSRNASTQSSNINSSSMTITEQPSSVKIGSNLCRNSGSWCTGCSTRQITINGQLLEMITDITAAITRLEKKIDSIVTESSHGGIPDDDTIALGHLPVQTEEQFTTLETKLSEEDRFRQKFIKVFASLGGKSTRGLVQNMMKRLLTDDLAETYSLSGKAGKNTEKNAFGHTEAFKVITAACKQMYQETDPHIREAVSDWLNQAKVRKMRREQQQKKHPRELPAREID